MEQVKCFISILLGFIILLMSVADDNSRRSSMQMFVQGHNQPDEPKPEFLSLLPNITVPQGRDVSFTCVVNNLGQYKVAWIKSDSKAMLGIHTHMVSLNPRLSVTHNGHNTWRLHISHVQLNDSGSYICQVNTDPMRSQNNQRSAHPLPIKSLGSASQIEHNSMDAVPLDYWLFVLPPKQRKQQQQQQQSINKTQSPKHHEGQASDECAKNSANHTNLSSSVSGKIRSKTADNSSNSGNSLSSEFQCSLKNITSPHIVQSGSYVEILKQAGNQAATAVEISPIAAQHDLLMGHAKNSLSSTASLACHNKSYGDFLTITPRRKGKLSGGDVKAGVTGEGDNYRHHLPHSIEPLHLLGIPNDNMSTFFDYRAMETLSNADTPAIGSTMAGHLYPSKIVNNKQPYVAAKNPSSITAQVPDEYHHIISENNLSPPSAFCDSMSSMNKA